MSLWYRTGTINLTNGSTALTGTGTAWVANVSPGMMVVYDRQIIGEVQSVNSNTSITLATAYAGTTISAGAYAIANLGAVRDGLIAAVNDALAVFQAAQDGALSGRFGDGTLSEPGIAFLSDINTGFRRPAADQIGMVTGGVQRALLSSAAFTLSVPITGSAVQSSATDTTAGRLMAVGAFGLGAAITLTASDNLDAVLQTGFYYNPTAGNTPSNNYPISSAGALLVIERTATNVVQEFTSFGGDGSPSALRKFSRSFGASGWTPWVEMFHQGRIVGTVSQSGGVPTGAVIERGSNANGEYVRFADGLQICTALVSTSDVADTVWTFPASFSTTGGLTPLISGAQSTTARTAGINALTTTTATFNLLVAATNARVATSVRVAAIGRWF